MPFIHTGNVLAVHCEHVLEYIQLLKVFSPWDLNYQQTISSVHQKEKPTKKPPPKPKPPKLTPKPKNLWHQIYYKQIIDF